MVDKEGYSEYSRCGLPYAISEEIPHFSDLIVHPDAWYKRAKINMFLKSEVKKINPSSQTIVFENLETKEVYEEHYDKLIIATGSIPKVPPIKGVADSKNVFFLKTMEDAKTIKEKAMSGSKDAIIIGAGLIGIESAEAFHHLGLNVTIIEFLPSVLPLMIDSDMSRILQEKMANEKINLFVNTAAKEIIEKNEKLTVIAEKRDTKEEIELSADLVVVATGMAPNVSLAKDAGIALGPLGGIKVNEKMQTNFENIYAAGDCVETINLITKKPFLSGLGTIAARQGRVAGMNAMGGDVTFPGAVAARVTKLFGMEIAATGITSYEAEKNEFDYISVRIKGEDREEYYPDRQTNTVKLIVDVTNGKILGGQIIGRGASHRVNLITTAIMHSLTLDDVINIETNYAPPIAPVWDPVAIAAMTALKKIERKKQV